MTNIPDLPRDELLATDIDWRLHAILEECVFPFQMYEDLDTSEREAFFAILRGAYGKGYCDALREDTEGKRGMLCLKHGYRAP